MTWLEILKTGFLIMQLIDKHINLNFDQQLDNKIKNFLLTAAELNEPRSEKTGLPGFRPGSTQTRLYSHRCLET